MFYARVQFMRSTVHTQIYNSVGLTNTNSIRLPSRLLSFLTQTECHHPIAIYKWWINTGTDHVHKTCTYLHVHESSMLRSNSYRISNNKINYFHQNPKTKNKQKKTGLPWFQPTSSGFKVFNLLMLWDCCHGYVSITHSLTSIQSKFGSAVYV